MRFRPMLSVILLAAYLPACMSYQATTQPLAELTAPPAPVESIRVTTTDGRRLTLASPRVIGDTLKGFRPDADIDPTVVAVPLAQVRSVEIRKKDEGGTAGLSLAVAAVLVVVGAAVMCGPDSWIC